MYLIKLVTYIKHVNKRFQNWFPVKAINDKIIYESKLLSLSHLLSDIKKT